ncbi:hypothetical protein HSB1_03350 [Halogranum salarium B-1]|uniref:Uncharacterized protein n=1 Tax=Halogranum salarium B-1 TaxID=1210908 RepID=J3JHU1_9EURY|nr:hypothetical protein HSB1_03350 [Halogranum salarium B-1]
MKRLVEPAVLFQNSSISVVTRLSVEATEVQTSATCVFLLRHVVRC